ncbi:MAG: hypothetical protein H0X27_07415 [Caulobacteraceae bacterium]|nr:hypothetical protein [Caulobacteraceae bacterium]
MLLLAAIAPGGVITGVPIAILALGGAWWALVCGEPDRRKGGFGWFARMLITQPALLGWWGVMLFYARRPVPLALSMAFACAVVASMAGSGSLMLWFHRQVNSKTRVATLACLAGIGVLAAFALAGYGVGKTPPALSAALVAVFVLAHRPASAVMQRRAFLFRYFAMFGGLFLIVALVANGVGTVVTLGGAWLLTGAAIGLVAVTSVTESPHGRTSG